MFATSQEGMIHLPKLTKQIFLSCTANNEQMTIYP